MTVREAVVRSQNGLYARPATFFVQKANEHHLFHLGGKKRSAVPMPRAFLGVLSMGITQGMKIQLIADGPDEVEALDDLVALLAGSHAGEVNTNVRDKAPACGAFIMDRQSVRRPL